MGSEAFTGRAQAYTKARPGYPFEAVEYIRNLASPDAVFADIGAGTGKFTELLAQYGNDLYAVEPNADMLEQLKIVLSPFPNVKIINGSAEATNLSNRSVDVIINAQSLNRFDIKAFRDECLRIGKPNPIIVTLYNDEPPYCSSRYKKSTGALYNNPVVREFPNPHFFTRDKWLLYFSSMEGVPQKSDAGYEAYTTELNDKFDRESVDGVLQLNLVTVVYSERIDFDNLISIRLAVPADAPNMAEVHMRSWEVAYKDIIPAEYVRDKNATRPALYTRVITDENKNSYVIQCNGKIVGIIKIAPPTDDDVGDNTYEVHYLYLHPDYFRMGIGTKAMEFAFDVARRLGKTDITVWVLDENVNSIRFYEKYGFTADGKAMNAEYGKVNGRIRMRMEI
jgi:ribosomal protein S18 acetylase RimI-like enzyme/ubiquinone/menaquinone biosynthesis C-methylase UbiE